MPTAAELEVVGFTLRIAALGTAVILLPGIAAYVSDSGEGRWTVQEAIDLGCSLPVITLALQNRFRSRTESPFSDKLLAAMRNQFGGHPVKRES